MQKDLYRWSMAAFGEIAGNAREELDRQFGYSVLSSANAKELELLDDSGKEEK